MRAVPILLLLALLAPAAWSMPVDDPPEDTAPKAGPVRVDSLGPGAGLIRERLRMQEEYEEFRQKRRLAQEAASASLESPGRDGVAGWKHEALDQTTIREEAPVVAERAGWESDILYVGGAGVLLLLLLKVFRPDWLAWRLGGRPEKAPPRGNGPMTVRLKPLDERMARKVRR